jgi:hypothetical protein
MTLIGCHTLLCTSEPEALRAKLRDVFSFESVDAAAAGLSSVFRLLNSASIPPKVRTGRPVSVTRLLSCAMTLSAPSPNSEVKGR